MGKLAPTLDQIATPAAVPAVGAAEALLLRRASEWMLAYWRRAREGHEMPPSTALDDLFATEFGPYCVGGQISMTEGPRVLRVGGRFTEAFERKEADRAGAFAAAAMLGLVVGLAGELQTDPRPHQRAGDFITDSNRLVHYHAVVLPFRGGLSGAPAWLAAAEWRMVPGVRSPRRLSS